MSITFESLSLRAELVNAALEQGYKSPSPIQEKAIPLVLKGGDVMAAAQTGTGKTAGFTLPILHLLADGKRPAGNQVRALILTPTRELAIQVEESVTRYGSKMPLRSTAVYGGVGINPQMKRLRGGIDILVATPGRLLDLYGQNAVRFDQLEILVLDEADRMLDMGFIRDVEKIIKLLPQQRQTLMFSATFSADIRQLAQRFLNNPKEVSVTPANTAAPSVRQTLHPTDKANKTKLLIALLNNEQWPQVLVFVRTRHGANRLARNLDKNNISAAAIHGDKSQGARVKALNGFKNGNIQVLVATDIAARGLDINQLPAVINFDLPQVAEDYVHRIGRTGRAGAKGHAITLVSADEAKQLNDIEQLLQKHFTREIVSGFEPSHDVPASKPIKPPKKARPKKNKGGAESSGAQPKPSGNARPGGRRRRGARSDGNNQNSNSAKRRSRPNRSRNQRGNNRSD